MPNFFSLINYNKMVEKRVLSETEQLELTKRRDYRNKQKEKRLKVKDESSTVPENEVKLPQVSRSQP